MFALKSLVGGLWSNAKKHNQYDDGNLLFMLRVGTCPSAGGARAPLAGIVSRFSLGIAIGIVTDRVGNFRLELRGIGPALRRN